MKKLVLAACATVVLSGCDTYDYGDYGYGGYGYAPAVVNDYPGYTYRKGYYYDGYNRRFDSGTLYRRYRHHRHWRR